MSDTILKAKVMFGSGLLVATLGGLYRPDVIEALLPVVMCIAIGASALFLPELVMEAKQVIAHRPRKPRTEPMASRLDDVQLTKGKSITKAAWVPAVDYENYFVPSYVRRECK